MAIEDFIKKVPPKQQNGIMVRPKLETVEWLRGIANEHNVSINAVVLAIIMDARTKKSKGK